MNNAVTYLIEPLLTQYFLIDAICDGFIDDSLSHSMFEELCRIFCVPLNDETELYYKAAVSSQYKELTDSTLFERLCRKIEYAKVTGYDVEIDETDRLILAKKRDALSVKSTIFKSGKNLTRDVIADKLLETAMDGNIDAMAVLSYMEYHGICVCMDRKNAVKRLRHCAKWNNLFGNLMGIAYDTQRRDSYFDTLYTIMKSSNRREAFRHVCRYSAYDRQCMVNSGARIIEKAFGMNIISRNSYDSSFANVAFSELVSDEDKEKILLTKKKGAVESLSEIPFDTKKVGGLPFDEENARDIAVCREDELSKIFCSIYPIRKGNSELYNAMLIMGDDYVCSMYAAAIKKGFRDCGCTFEVDASMLTMHDFMGSKENFIIRALSETKKSRTVFLLKNCDGIGEQELEELVKLLDCGYRRRFKLSDPAVSLDLSDVAIILFASECNEKVRVLSGECDIVNTEPLSTQEKADVIDVLLNARKKTFDCEDILIDSECREYLSSFKPGQIMRIIDSALKKAAYENESVINAGSLRAISEQHNIRSGKREFGYIGGHNEEY